MGPSRISEIPPEERTPDQVAALEALLAGRGRIPTPYKIWLHSPTLALAMERLGTFIANESSLSAREVELATILIAQQWHGSYVFEAHVRQAAVLGVAASILDAIRSGCVPDFTEPREKLIYQLVMGAREPAPIADAAFESAVAALGHAGIADLFGLIGYYSAVAIAMKTYRVPQPAGSTP